MIKNGQQGMEAQFSSDSGEETEDKNSKLESNNDEQLLNKITNTTSGNNPEGYKNANIEKLYNLYIESKHIKIVRYKKMTPTICKLQEIHTDLWGLHDLLSLLKGTYVGLLFSKFTRKL